MFMRNIIFCKISEKKQETEDENLNKSIITLIGKTLSEFKTLKNPEVNDFRYRISLLGEEIASRRSTMTLKEKILYQYPPKVAKTPEIPQTVRLRENQTFWILARLPNDVSFTIEANCSMYPTQLLEAIFHKKKSKLHIDNKHRHSIKDYILKICGQEEYIYGDHPLIQFLYIQDTLSRNSEVPTVVLMQINDVYVFTSIFRPTEHLERTHSQSITTKLNTSTLKKKRENICSWDVDENFQCTVHAIRGLTYDSNRSVEIGIQAGLFHGGKSLCEKQKTSERTLQTATGSVEWNETLKFDLKVANLPRMTRLCLVVFEVAKKSSGLRARRIKDANKEMYIIPIAWVNTTVYDYKNQLKTGDVTFYTWSYSEESGDAEDLGLHPLGTVEPNPRTDECSSITLNFHNYMARENASITIVYPTEEQMLAYAEGAKMRGSLKRDDYIDDRTIRDILLPYVNNDRLNEIPEQERNAIWEKRQEILETEPSGLNCLINCVEWNNKNEVAEITALLKKWPILCVERALELLDYAYADVNVRRYAVNCLKIVRDEELLLYLLQLVQAMKHGEFFR
jgi:phosphatidylinositol-4,5-bisphosphate 3-kinase